MALKYRVPLVDYHAAILERRPGRSWDGTLISKDGVHPTAGKTHVYSEENLRVSGYALRNWVNFLMYRRIYFRILKAPKSWNRMRPGRPPRLPFGGLFHDGIEHHVGGDFPG